MNNAKMYAECNKISLRDTAQCLEENLSKITWNKDSELVIIDIGCGDGRVTSEILQKYLPENFKELLGCDISEAMVRFATERYAAQRIKFQILDIGGTIPEQLCSRFDHVYSFYALHFVPNQQKAFSNVFNLLAPGGSTLMSIIGTYPCLYEVYLVLSRSTKWSKWLSNVNDSVSPYHNRPQACANTWKIMTEIGFTDVEVVRKEKSYCQGSVGEYRKFVRAVNAFPIPDDVFDEYLDEFVQVAQDMGYVDQNYKYDYDCVIVYGRKPK